MFLALIAALAAALVALRAQNDRLERSVAAAKAVTP
jgi:hypothetical protein